MTLICLGDSLTYGYGIPRPRVWPSLLAGATGMRVYNWGINGDTTGGMLARFQAHGADRDVHAAILMGGFNDLALGAEPGVVKANMFALVQQCFSARIKPLLGIPIPVRRPITFPLLASMDVERACAAYEDLRLWLHSLAEDFSLPRVDFYRCFEEVSASAMQSGDRASFDALYTDGLHASEAGHALMAQEAARVIRGL